VKAAAVRKCATDHDAAAIEAAIEAVTEREELPIEVDGDDLEEKLTHLLLAARIHARVADGEDFKTAFRVVLGEVRDVLTNE
jgi:hypothetical protein